MSNSGTQTRQGIPGGTDRVDTFLMWAGIAQAVALAVLFAVIVVKVAL